MRWVDDCSSLRGLVPATVRAFLDLARLRPDVVVSAGTGLGLAYFLAASPLRVVRVWLETFNVHEQPGRVSRWCARRADLVLEQRPGVEHTPRRRRRVVIGELL